MKTIFDKLAHLPICKFFAWCSIACLLTGCPDFASPRPAPPMAPPPTSKHASSGSQRARDAKAIDVIRTYSGVCSMNASNAANADNTANMKEFAIYSASDFQDFIQRIPKELPSMTNPAPKNDDPLLGEPDIDFEKHMAIVLLQPDTLNSIPKVLSVREDDDTIWVEAEYPAKPPGEQFPEGMGTYTVVIVPYSGEIKAMSFSIGAH